MKGLIKSKENRDERRKIKPIVRMAERKMGTFGSNGNNFTLIED